MCTSVLGSIDVSADGSPPLTAQISPISESLHTALGSPISKLPSYLCNASCNTERVLLAIGIGTSEEGGSGGVCGGDVGGSGV